MNETDKEDLAQMQKKLRLRLASALAQAYSMALRSGMTPDKIAARAGKPIEWVGRCLTDPSSLDLDECSTFALCCDCYLEPFEITRKM